MKFIYVSILRDRYWFFSYVELLRVCSSFQAKLSLWHMLKYERLLKFSKSIIAEMVCNSRPFVLEHRKLKTIQSLETLFADWKSKQEQWMSNLLA